MTNLANSRHHHRRGANRRKLIPLLLAAATGLLPVGASAHHSHAMFDSSKTMTVQGTVKSFLYSNPHIWLFLVVPGDKGQEVNFPIEGTNVQAAGRMAITSSTFKPGDKVSVLINPYRDGRPGGSWREATDARGNLHKPERGGD